MWNHAMYQQPASEKQNAKMAAAIRSRYNPATLLSFTLSVVLFAGVIFELASDLREIIRQGQQGSFAVGYTWAVFAWLFAYVPLTVASLVTTPRPERGFAYLVMLFPWVMMVLISGFVAFYRANM
jgi:hypothetical protein